MKSTRALPALVRPPCHRAGPFKYSSNDGTGIHLPLTPGAQWKFSIDVVNTGNGMTFKRTGSSKVLGQESLTTKAGTFHTFVIETDFTGELTKYARRKQDQ